MEAPTAELIEAWRTNNRINLFLIDAIDDAGMKSTLSSRGGRNVVRQFAHLHNLRVWQLEKRAPDLAKGIKKYGSKDEPTKKALKAALTQSGERIERFLADVLAGVPKRRGFKKGMFTTFAYFIAHESHHRGSILLTAKQCGHGLGSAMQYSIWDWDRL